MYIVIFSLRFCITGIIEPFDKVFLNFFVSFCVVPAGFTRYFSHTLAESNLSSHPGLLFKLFIVAPL